MINFKDKQIHNKIFFRARIKLTVTYIGIITVILVIFSLVLFYSLTQNIHDNLDGNFSDEKTQALVIGKTTDQLQNTIFFVDLMVLFVSSGISYFLAGKTLHPIQQAMERQRRFTDDASHELRTPLAVMQTNLEVTLRDTEWSHEKIEALIIATLEEVDLMKKMTEDLLVLSRIENKKEPYIFEKINIVHLVDVVVKEMKNIAMKHQIQLSVAPLDAVFIQGDAHALKQLIINIVANALNFTPAGGSVHVSTYTHDRKVTIHVQDTGIGIAEKDLSHVFERLYQADETRGHHESGAGLGLSIAQEIAYKHKGNIKIESKSGEGTLVIITFPVIF